MFKISVVEDDFDTRNRIVSALNEYSKAHNVLFQISAFDNADAFVSTYKHDVDIIFMDIELPGINGMDATKLIRKRDQKVIIVFVTNMASYAVEGYQVNALDFILKPLDKSTFEMKMNRIMDKAKLNQDVFISISYNHQTVLINISELIYVEVVDHYLYFHLTKNEYKVRGSLNSYEDDLTRKGFLRCNNYAIVNPFYIIGINQDNVIIRNGKISISRQRKKAFLESLANYLGRN